MNLNISLEPIFNMLRQINLSRYNLKFNETEGYWYELKKDGIQEGHYCPRCKSQRNKLTPMRDMGGCYQCTVCQYDTCGIRITRI